jgi:hypothetical protein
MPMADSSRTIRGSGTQPVRDDGRPADFLSNKWLYGAPAVTYERVWERARSVERYGP